MKKIFLFTKITLIIFIIVITSLIAEFVGILDVRYGSYILIAGILIQILLLAFLIIAIMNRKRELTKGIKIIRHKFEDKFIKGDTEILPKFMTSTNPRKSSIFKIFFQVKDFKEPPEFGILKMDKGNIKSDEDIKKHLLDVNAQIIEGSFIFDADIIVNPEEKINFKFKKDTNIKLFFIGELYLP